MNIGKAIKICRQSRRLTQEELATMLDISKSYLSQIEKERRQPTLSLLEDIALKLKIPISILTFMACKKEEITELPEDLIEKLSSLTMKLMREDE